MQQRQMLDDPLRDAISHGQLNVAGFRAGLCNQIELRNRERVTSGHSPGCQNRDVKFGRRIMYELSNHSVFAKTTKVW